MLRRDGRRDRRRRRARGAGLGGRGRSSGILDAWGRADDDDPGPGPSAAPRPPGPAAARRIGDALARAARDRSGRAAGDAARDRPHRVPGADRDPRRGRGARRSCGTRSTSGPGPTTATTSRPGPSATSATPTWRPLHLAWGVAKAMVLRARVRAERPLSARRCPDLRIPLRIAPSRPDSPRVSPHQGAERSTRREPRARPPARKLARRPRPARARRLAARRARDGHRSRRAGAVDPARRVPQHRGRRDRLGQPPLPRDHRPRRRSRCSGTTGCGPCIRSIGARVDAARQRAVREPARPRRSSTASCGRTGRCATCASACCPAPERPGEPRGVRRRDGGRDRSRRRAGARRAGRGPVPLARRRRRRSASATRTPPAGSCTSTTGGSRSAGVRAEDLLGTRRPAHRAPGRPRRDLRVDERRGAAPAKSGSARCACSGRTARSATPARAWPRSATPTGAVSGYVGTLEDVTDEAADRQRAERALEGPGGRRSAGRRDLARRS